MKKLLFYSGIILALFLFVFRLCSMTELDISANNYTREINQVNENDSMNTGMVFVKGGEFQMGDRFFVGYSNEYPIHKVNLSNYYIGKFEVTQKGWLKYMPDMPFRYGSGDSFPVYNISWYEAIVYCNKRSIDEKLTPCYSIKDNTDPNLWGNIPSGNDSTWNKVTCDWTADGYRLPTEAEWEYAASGGKFWKENYQYSGSSSIFEVAWFASNSDIKVHPVGMKKNNMIGVYDMTGNSIEWCWDWYSSDYYSECKKYGIIKDPKGPESGTCRIQRSGSFKDPFVFCRVAYRGYFFPFYRYHFVGIRLVRNDTSH